jgi:hypothetical protein
MNAVERDTSPVFCGISTQIIEKFELCFWVQDPELRRPQVVAPTPTAPPSDLRLKLAR